MKSHHGRVPKSAIGIGFTCPAMGKPRRLEGEALPTLLTRKLSGLFEIRSCLENRRVRRRTMRAVRARRSEDHHHHHHHVYVVLLEPGAGKLRAVRKENPDRDPEKPCVYVGMTGLTPEARFANHKAGIKDAYVVRRFGVRLMPELYEHLNPMPFEAAAEMEADLAEDLRLAGYTVTGGH